MIKTGNFIVIASLAIIFLLSVCEDETRKYELNTDLTGKLISYSECKSNKSVSEKSGNKDFSSINYKYFPLSGILRINHVNAGFNCCPDSIYCTIY